MTIWQTMKIVWTNIFKNRMRSFLTMLGMIIGVASVIILVSIMQSYFNSMLDSYADMGLYNVSVSIIGRNGDVKVSEEDIYQYAAERKNTIKGVTPTVQFRGSLYKNGIEIENPYMLLGIDEYYMDFLDKKVETGHSFTYSDMATRSKVCIIGSYVNQKLFKGMCRQGDTIRLNGEELTVIGILKEESDSTQWTSDNSLYLPYTTAMRLSGTGSIGSYEFYIKDSTLVASETVAIKEYLFDKFHDTKAYSVTNMLSMLNELNVQMGILTSIIAGIAGISLVVAGVGIMNIMLVSVSERVKEIGIRKSLGAKHRDIMRQFIFEAGLTSTIGGVLGILLGTFLTIQGGKLVKINALPSTNSIILAFGVSVGVGILFGYLPARKAAKLNPIDALRNE